MGRHRAAGGDRFQLLFVCTGNICRSPLAEILMRHLLRTRAVEGIDVASAGVQAVVGAAMHPDSRAQLRPFGLDGPAAGGFRARQLAPSMVEESDLVLGAGPRHRTSVVECSPAGLVVAFSLREFARLAARVDPRVLPDGPVDRAHALVDHVRNGRGMAPPVAPEADRIPDPMGRPPQAHHEAAQLIHEALRVVVDVLAPADPVGRTARIPTAGRSRQA